MSAEGVERYAAASDGDSAAVTRPIWERRGYPTLGRYLIRIVFVWRCRFHLRNAKATGSMVDPLSMPMFFGQSKDSGSGSTSPALQKYDLGQVWTKRGFATLGEYLFDAYRKAERRGTNFKQTAERLRKYAGAEQIPYDYIPGLQVRLRSTLEPREDNVRRIGYPLPPDDTGLSLRCIACRSKFYAHLLPADCPHCGLPTSDGEVSHYLDWIQKIVMLRPVMRRLLENRRRRMLHDVRLSGAGYGAREMNQKSSRQ